MADDKTKHPEETEPTPEEWLELLRKGVEPFDRFREGHPDWIPRFPGRADLRETNVRGANLENARLERADLRRAHLEGTDLRRVQGLEEAILDGVLVEYRNPTPFTYFYFSIVTFTTLGFGDVVPKDLLGEILLSVEVVLGYVMLGGLISILATKLARRS